MNKPELLAPAGSLEKGRMALLYGADAVYLGGKAFGLRAFAANFSLEEIREMAAFAHARGKKVYVTVNIYPHNSDLTALPEYLRNLEEAGVDALLVSDLGVWMTARKTVPKLGLHVSTQANVTNWAAAKAWEELGAERVVLARELSIQEIREIREKISADLEVFVHGAILFRPLPPEQLFHRPGQQSGRLCPGLPLGVRPDGKEPAWRGVPDSGR